MKAILLFCFVFYLMMTSPLRAQLSQRSVTEADYGLWSTMTVGQLSDLGNWATYSLHYENAQDTLFVKHTKTLRTFAFAKGINGRFAKERLFVCQGTAKELILTDLSNGKQERLEGVSSYVLSREGRFLMIQRTAASTGDQELFIKDLEGKQHTIIPNVSTYSYNSKSNALICVSASQLLLFYLDTPFKKNVIADNTESTYSDIVWQKNGESLAYFIHATTTKIAYYRLKGKQLYTFDPLEYDSFPKDSQVYNASFTALTISDDGSKVFFGLKTKERETDTTAVQLWNTEDKMLYPYKRLINGWKEVPKLAIWWIESNRFQALTNNEFPNVMLTGDQKYALLYNPIANEPQFDRSAPIDFYLTNLETAKQKMILPQQTNDESKLSVSSTGKYIVYFRDKNWWVYDVPKDSHSNLTKGIEVAFESEDYVQSGANELYGIAGWTNYDDALLVYDKYDVWLIKTDGSGFSRLTNGREGHIVFRIVPQSEINLPTINFRWMKKGFFNLDDGLLLQASTDLKNGYFRWDMKKGLRQLVFNANRISNFKKSKFNDVYAYTIEHYHKPPQLVVKVKNSNQIREIYQTNTQQKNYQWGFSKLISYTNSKGKLLKGALFYPAAYNPHKSYPMVIHIYERQSNYYNQYISPTNHNSMGFNISNLTSQGYFVLLPDIDYEVGNAGRSALDCVVSAVNEVLVNESVDPKRLGLIGHSFGGYETNFIITQTNMFATAVSGSGVADMISDYLYVAWNILKPNVWRYEHHIYRMGTSLFNDRESYTRNSPLTYVEKVKTPLLLWSGEDDKQVHYYQSLEFHLALRRLQKPNILLLYEGERHLVLGRNHQIDLTHRVQDWFDYYLKQGKRPDWFTPNQL